MNSRGSRFIWRSKPGSEEGGWYYHNRYLVCDVDPKEIGTDRYGEGYEIYSEFYLGQNEKTGREYYC